MTGNEILAIRTRLQLTQEALARQIGCSTATVRRWESLDDTELAMMDVWKLKLRVLERTAARREVTV